MDEHPKFVSSHMIIPSLSNITDNDLILCGNAEYEMVQVPIHNMTFCFMATGTLVSGY
jgi:hypothetical protein